MAVANRVAEMMAVAVVRGVRMLEESRSVTRHSTGLPFTFKAGLSSITTAMTARIGKQNFMLGLPVVSLEYCGDGVDGSWKVGVRAPDGSAVAKQHRREKFDAVVLALPAASLASLRISSNGQATSLPRVSAVESLPLSVLLLGFKDEDAKSLPCTAGFAVPAMEGGRLSSIACQFTSKMFAFRAPAGYSTVTLLLGGDRQRDRAFKSRIELEN
eukprot:gene20076-24034_t